MRPSSPVKITHHSQYAKPQPQVWSIPLKWHLVPSSSRSYRTIAESPRYGLCSGGHAMPLSDSIHKVACVLKIVCGKGFGSGKCWLAWQSSGETKDFCPSVFLLDVPGDPDKAHPRLSDSTLVWFDLAIDKKKSWLKQAWRVLLSRK
jgi:hypothetical protein